MRIDLEGDEEAIAKLKKLALFLSDLRPFWPLVVPLFVGWMRRQFESEGGYLGRPWAPLSPRYKEWKDENYPGRPLLILKGGMRQAASSPRRDARPLSLTLTIVDEKAGYHQKGSDRMPARPLIPDGPLPASATAELDFAAEQYVGDIVQRLGLGKGLGR